jgi:dihydroorotate dehydrogenase (NAD+) catalytic subunit
MDVDLSCIVGGLRLDAPFVLASGIVDNEHSLILRAFDAGASMVVTKTVFKNPREGYSPPVYYENEFYALNAVGLPNKGITSFSSEIKKAKAAAKPVFVSVGGYDAEEYACVAKQAVQAGADGLELNLSCPHVKSTGAEIGADPSLIKQIVEAVKENVVDKPVFTKLTPNTDDIVKLGRAALDAGADGLTAVNTARGMGFDPFLETPLLSNFYGGVSGKALHPIAVYAVYALRKNFPDAPIFGVGGVYTWLDALDFFLAGADAIQVGSVVSTKGHRIFTELREGLASFLSSKGYNSLQSFKKIRRPWF